MLTIGKCLGDIRTKRCGTIPYALLYPRKDFEIQHESSGESEAGSKRLDETLKAELWFLMARHRKTRELSDLGGGIKKMEDTLTGGIRELHEESRGIFSDLYKSPADIGSCVAVIDNNADMAEIFVPIGPEWLVTAEAKFHNAAAQKKHLDEMSELVWVSEETMTELVWGPKDLTKANVLWDRIRSFMRKTIQTNTRDRFYQYLKNRALLLLVQKPVVDSQVFKSKTEPWGTETRDSRSGSPAEGVSRDRRRKSPGYIEDVLNSRS